MRDKVNQFVQYARAVSLMVRPERFAEEIFTEKIGLRDSIRIYIFALTVFGAIAWAYGTEAEISTNPTLEELFYGEGVLGVPFVGGYLVAFARFVVFTLIFIPVHYLRLQSSGSGIKLKFALSMYFVYCAPCVPLDAIYIFSHNEDIKVTISLVFLGILTLFLFSLGHLYNRSIINVLFSVIFVIVMWVFVASMIFEF